MVIKLTKKPAPTLDKLKGLAKTSLNGTVVLVLDDTPPKGMEWQYIVRMVTGGKVITGEKFIDLDAQTAHDAAMKRAKELANEHGGIVFPVLVFPSAIEKGGDHA